MNSIRNRIPRIRKGRDPFTPITLGLIILTTGVTSYLYNIKSIDVNNYITLLSLQYGIILAVFGLIRLKYPWMKIKGKYHSIIGTILIIISLILKIGLLKAIFITLIISGIILILNGTKNFIKKLYK